MATLIIDAHEDLAYNMLSFGRDYCLSASEIRQSEEKTDIPESNGHTMLGWPEYQLGQITIIFGSLFAVPIQHHKPEWGSQFYENPDRAYHLYRAQVDTYEKLTDTHPEKYCLIRNLDDLSRVLHRWEQSPASYPENTNPTGIVMTMEGAEGIRHVEELEEWWEVGVRIIGPVWAGTRFCGGMFEPGTFSNEGFNLLEVMLGLGFTLDISHMREKSALQALDRYEGTVIASHGNARALLDGDPKERHLSDRVIRLLIERGGVIGVIPYNLYIKKDWKPSDGRQSITLDMLIAHIDHICQIAGNADHAGIGTDFDGGFGFPDVPYEMNTIADLQKIVPLLQKKGYDQTDISAIMGANWQRILESTLPGK